MFRSHLIIVVILFIASGLQAQVRGYIVYANNDTLACSIKLKGKGNPTRFDRVTIIDSAGNEKLYKTNDKEVLAYGIEDAGIHVDYRYFEFNYKTESGFYRLINNGPKYKLYVIYISTQTNGITTTMPYYVLENIAGQFERFGTCVVCPWRKMMRQLMSDDPAALLELENIKAREIPAFVARVNKL